jgi:hypothetical protein
MSARQVVLLAPSKSSHPRRLLSRQHCASISPLSATLMNLPASVANKRLTPAPNRLDATLTKNTGRVNLLTLQRSNAPFASRTNLRDVQTCNDPRPNSLHCAFLANPLTLKSYPSTSYKNHRGGGVAGSANLPIGFRSSKQNRNPAFSPLSFHHFAHSSKLRIP